MIKKLRRKFILIAALAVALALGGIIGAINIGNYLKIGNDADGMIALLAENGGSFPSDISPAQPQKPDKGTNGMSAETPFETRYFSVTLDGEGNAAYTDVKNIAAISAEEAAEYAEKLFSQGKTKGYFGIYRYGAETENGQTLYVFVDCGKALSTFRSFLTTSLLISAGGLLLVVLLVVLLSKPILRPIEESYAKQKNFITNASHDIKTPLTVINADTEVIELDRGANEWTADIKRQIARLISLTDKLVFLSRMEESGKPPDMAAFDLSEMAEETCLPYEAFAVSKGLTLSADIQPGVTYFGNEDMLRQAFALLMDNAVKYAKESGNVSVTLKKTGKGCELHFKNDAENIRQGNREELFERFYRSDKSRNPATGGHGIGLSVVKAVVEAHGGRITAFSPDGNSLDFRIVL